MSPIQEKAKHLGNNLVAMFNQMGAKSAVVQDLGTLLVVRINQSRLWHPLTPTILTVALELDETRAKVLAVTAACDDRNILSHQDSVKGIVKNFFNAETKVVGELPPAIYQRIAYGHKQSGTPLRPREIL